MSHAVLNLLKRAVALRENAAFTRRLGAESTDAEVADRLYQRAIELEYQADLVVTRVALLREKMTRTRAIAAELEAVVEESRSILKENHARRGTSGDESNSAPLEKP